MPPTIPIPSVDRTERLIEAIHMLTIEIRNMNAMLKKPRSKRPKYGQVFAEYLRAQS